MPVPGNLATTYRFQKVYISIFAPKTKTYDSQLLLNPKPKPQSPGLLKTKRQNLQPKTPHFKIPNPNLPKPLKTPNPRPEEPNILHWNYP